MVHLISDYDLGYRLAIIEKGDETEHNDSFERLYYSDGRITFRSDNASIALNEKLSLFFDSLHSGDIISINIPELKLEIKVSDEEMQARKAKWQPREPKVTTGYLARYAAMVTSGNRGAILEVPKAK